MEELKLGGDKNISPSEWKLGPKNDCLIIFEQDGDDLIFVSQLDFPKLKAWVAGLPEEPK